MKIWSANPARTVSSHACMEGTSQVFLPDVIEGRNQNRLDPRLQKHKRYSCKNKKRHITDAITRTIKVLSNQIENARRPQAKAKGVSGRYHRKVTNDGQRLRRLRTPYRQPINSAIPNQKRSTAGKLDRRPGLDPISLCDSTTGMKNPRLNLRPDGRVFMAGSACFALPRFQLVACGWSASAAP